MDLSLISNMSKSSPLWLYQFIIKSNSLDPSISLFISHNP